MVHTERYIGDAINDEPFKDEPGVQTRPCLDTLLCAESRAWYKREGDGAGQGDRPLSQGIPSRTDGVRAASRVPRRY